MCALRTDTVAPSDTGAAARVVGALPAALITVALAGVGAWGWSTDWHFGLSASHSSTHHSRPVEALAAVHLTPTEGPALADVVFPSAEVVDTVGIDVAPAWNGPIVESIVASGEIRFDPSRTARLSSRSAGTAARVFQASGARVKAGDLLALIDAADVGRAKTEFQQALVQARLTQRALANVNAAGHAIAEPQRQEAAAAARNAEVRLLGAEQALVNLGLPVRSADFRAVDLDEVVRRMRLLGTNEQEAGPLNAGTANLLPVRSPLDGVLLTADVVMGEVVDPSRVLFVVADPSRVWFTLHVAADSILKLRFGQKVRFRPDGVTDDFDGTVTWTGTAADETTRTIPVRAEADNRDGRLRASTLGVGRIVIREEASALLVPSDAVVPFQSGSIVFVRSPDYLKPDTPKSFQARVVLTGARDGGNTEIRGGLKTGDVIASKGVAILLGEFKRASGEAVPQRAEVHP